jgi:hypothetical protein
VTVICCRFAQSETTKGGRNLSVTAGDKPQMPRIDRVGYSPADHDSMFFITVSAPLGAQALAAIWCEREIGEIAELPGSNKFRWFEWATISSVVSAMIAAVILVLKLQSDHIIPTGKRPLDIDHLTAVMKGALTVSHQRYPTQGSCWYR